ncbi:MAG: lipoyl(octanoyl) transferase [Myxococcota bacterium]
MIKVERLGRLSYAAAQEVMAERLASRIAGTIPDTLLLCEHDPVYTVGRSRGAGANVLDAGGVEVVSVRRGGDVTFHGPGQVVGYPIFALPPHRHDLHGFLHGLEDALIEAIAGYGVVGGRDARNTGVWVGGRKIAAIGIACRRWVTWHGFALNVDVDLSYFERINPCGMDSGLVTRLVDEVCGPSPTREAAASAAAAAVGAWWARWTSPVCQDTQAR